jgi:hypothetical protein
VERRRFSTTFCTEAPKQGVWVSPRNLKASDLCRSEAFRLYGRYWDRTSDLFGVNYGTKTALTCGNKTLAGRRGSVQVR